MMTANAMLPTPASGSPRVRKPSEKGVCVLLAPGYETGVFLQVNQQPPNHPPPPDGAFVRGQIEAQRDQPYPVSFTAPDGTKCRMWLANDSRGNQIIGDDRWWRVNVTDLLKQEEERRPITPWTPTTEALRRPIIVVGRNGPVRDVDDALRTVKGFTLRICIESEKELQILGCGWRIVTCQFRGNKVLLYHNGSNVTMKRKAFKELLAANKRLRRKRPALRLVVSNPPRVTVEAAA
jgi:hypothetical protein